MRPYFLTIAVLLLTTVSALAKPERPEIVRALPAGPHTLVWNGTDDAGRTVVSGGYPLRLVVGKEVRLQRLVLVK